MELKNPSYPNFLSKEDPAFSTFQITLDNLFQNLCTNGVGVESCHTESISSEDNSGQQVLWILTPPKAYYVVYSTSTENVSALRGGQEHRDLRISQLQQLYKPDRYVYSGKASKNRPVWLNQVRLEHKTVTIVANRQADSHSPVYLLDKHLDKLPKSAIEKAIFYCKPLPTTPSNKTNLWYYAVSVGKNIRDNCKRYLLWHRAR